MHFKHLIIIILVISNKFCESQKVKDYNTYFKYMVFPMHPLKDENFEYSYTFIEQDEDLGKTIITENGNLNNNTRHYSTYIPSYPKLYYSKIGKGKMPYKMNFEIGKIHVIQKEFEMKKYLPSEAANNPPKGYYNLKVAMRFNFTFKDGNDSIIDSYIKTGSNEKIIIFPDYIPEMIPQRPLQTKFEVENHWLNKGEQFLQLAETKLALEALGEFKKNINKNHATQKDQILIAIYYLKDKKNQNPAFDSIINCVKLAVDSCDANYKAENNKNWHTQFIQTQFKQAYQINERITNYYTANKEKCGLDKETFDELIIGLFKNRILLLMLTNNYTDAIKDLEDIKKKDKYPKHLTYLYTDMTLELLNNEYKRYNKTNIKKYDW